MLRKQKRINGAALGAALAVAAVPAGFAFAATSNLTQTINAGTLTTSIRDAGGAVVGSPSFGMSAATVQTSGTQATTTGTFGSGSQRITVDNPSAVTTGTWTLTIAATGGASATWTDASKTYPFNGASAAAGQLTIDPSVATLTAVTGGTTGVSTGTSGTFSGGTNTPITLLTGASTSADVWNGYITGVGVSQTIPNGTAAGSYSIDLTQTIASS